MEAPLPILFEDERLLVINKPAGLVCHPTKGDESSSLVGRVRRYLGRPAHLINRLDRETSGVVVVGKTPAAAAEAARAWGGGAVRKTYLAIVHGRVRPDQGLVNAPLGRDEAAEVAIKDRVRPDGAAAVTRFGLLKAFRRAEGEFTLLEVRPETGRKHQIRIHLAHLGHPVVGDKLYGGDEHLYLDFVKNRLAAEQRRRLILAHQALHAARIELCLRGVDHAFEAEPEPEFKAFAAWSG